MKKLYAIIIAAALFMIPSFATAAEGEITISADVLAVGTVSVEYAWNENLGIGLNYSTVLNPYFRYYFAGDDSSFYLGAGYSTIPTAELGYNFDVSFLTINLGLVGPFPLPVLPRVQVGFYF